jgi:hypothetical protein
MAKRTDGTPHQYGTVYPDGKILPHLKTTKGDFNGVDLAVDEYMNQYGSLTPYSAAQRRDLNGLIYLQMSRERCCGELLLHSADGKELAVIRPDVKNGLRYFVDVRSLVEKDDKKTHGAAKRLAFRPNKADGYERHGYDSEEGCLHWLVAQYPQFEGAAKDALELIQNEIEQRSAAAARQAIEELKPIIAREKKNADAPYVGLPLIQRYLQQQTGADRQDVRKAVYYWMFQLQGNEPLLKKLRQANNLNTLDDSCRYRWETDANGKETNVFSFDSDELPKTKEIDGKSYSA